MNAPADAAPLRFGRFELHPVERRLLADGQAVVLGARAFDLLLALAERPGRLVGKRALMDLVWPDLVVQENNLAAQMSALRKVLGGDVVATIPGRGYRFVARIESAPEAMAMSPPAAPAPRTNLPAALPALLGRADELRALAALLERHRLVSVVGAGGIGKSLLAQHLLAGRRTDYAHGVCWVELGPVADAAALPGAIAAALGVEGGRAEPRAALIAALAPLTLLLALDNAEHLLAEVADLCAALHDAAPGLRLLVTSQAPLKLGPERVFRVGPLNVPDAALPAAQALGYASVALFTERAQAVDARFVLTEANAGAVIEVCRALDGLPLAIELAAARAPLLGLPRLLLSMQERLRLLTNNRNRAAPARQQTLRAALEWSHGLLSAREQQALRRLGVVVGSASLELVGQLLAEDGADEWDRLALLDTLVERSLVAVLAAPDDDSPRYRLLASTRAFALEQLLRCGETAALQRRHALALAALFDAAYDDYFDGGTGADAWLRRLGPDLDNARDAFSWARAAGDTPTQLAIGATLLRALPPSLHAQRMALADACEPGVGPPAADRLQLRAWIELSCAWADTQKPRARDAAQRALALARARCGGADDRFMLYHALCRFASAVAQAGDPAAAQAPLDELRTLEDPRWPPQRRLWGAEAAHAVARMRGDVAATLARGRELPPLDRARGSDAATALGNLIDAELAAGDAAAAVREGTELVTVLQGTRHEYSLAFARVNLCAAWLALDEPGRARDLAQAAWPQALVFELQHVAATYAALLAALEERPRSAARLLGYAAAIYAARDEARELNEDTATRRATMRASSVLGDADFARLFAEGARLSEAEAGALAFGRVDSR